jgi:AcrR family transcriptional regulator
MDGFERRKEKSKVRIIKAALELFGRLGINKVSIYDIARQANVSHVTIYNLFKGKDGLVEECLNSIMPELIQRMRDLINDHKPYLEKLEAMLQYFVQVSESSRGFSDIDVNSYPQYKELENSYINQIYDLVVKFIQQGQKKGYLNPDISEKAVKAIIEIFIQGINSNPELHERTHHDPDLFHELLHLLLLGFSRVDGYSEIKKVLK